MIRGLVTLVAIGVVVYMFVDSVVRWEPKTYIVGNYRFVEYARETCQFEANDGRERVRLRCGSTNFMRNRYRYRPE